MADEGPRFWLRSWPPRLHRPTGDIRSVTDTRSPEVTLRPLPEGQAGGQPAKAVPETWKEPFIRHIRLQSAGKTVDQKSGWLLRVPTCWDMAVALWGLLRCLLII